LLTRLVAPCRPTLHYWMETEVHVYAFSIAANLLLSFFPFLIVMVGLCQTFGWRGAKGAIFIALRDYFPDQLGDFITRNLTAFVESMGPLPLFSILLLFFTANGIFEPLEVALNRAWGATTNRTFLKNQIVSLGLIFVCGALALLSTVLTGLNREVLTALTGSQMMNNIGSVVFFKAAALPISILMLFLVYWVLPNVKVSPVQVLPAAIVIGIALEVFKYVNLLLWPWFYAKLRREYGPFVNSAAILFLGFFSAMIVLAGAEWSARHRTTLVTEEEAAHLRAAASSR